MNAVRAGIVGVTGYVGSEIARWLLGHPQIQLVAACSTSRVGEALTDAVPALLGVTDLVLEPVDVARLAELDVVFLATPHGAARRIAAALEEAALLSQACFAGNAELMDNGPLSLWERAGVRVHTACTSPRGGPTRPRPGRPPPLAGEGAGVPSAHVRERGSERPPIVVDASADHRLDPAWVTGPPELADEAMRGARRIAAPGCFATAVMLAVGPLVRAGAVTGPVCVSAATGSTGSGATPSATTHHPERYANLRAYAVGTHRHVPEIEAFLGTLGEAPRVHLVPHSAPVDRGIFATCFVPVRPDLDPAAILADAYASAPLVRFRAGSPELRLVRGTAFADLSVHVHDGICTVLVALDNLGKGAAAQAVQCANLAAGLPAQAGLSLAAVTP